MIFAGPIELTPGETRIFLAAMLAFPTIIGAATAFLIAQRWPAYILGGFAFFAVAFSTAAVVRPGFYSGLVLGGLASVAVGMAFRRKPDASPPPPTSPGTRRQR